MRVPLIANVDRPSVPFWWRHEVGSGFEQKLNVPSKAAGLIYSPLQIFRGIDGISTDRKVEPLNREAICDHLLIGRTSVLGD